MFTGCLQLLEILKILEIYWNLKTLLDIMEISWSLVGPPGNYYVRYRRSVPDRLYKKLVALFYLCYDPMLYKMHIVRLLYI